MHQVTSVVSMGCAVNIFVLRHLGDMAPLDMTLSLFIQTPKLKVCELSTWPEFEHSFLLYHGV